MRCDRNEWQTREYVERYLSEGADVPHRDEGERVLVDVVPTDAACLLDLGTGDGRNIALLAPGRPLSRAVGVDSSTPMLDIARNRFEGAQWVEFVEHDLNRPLPALGTFDAVVSSMAIHHLEDERKRSLYGEVFELLVPGGVFVNFEHVASPTRRLHERFFQAIGEPLECEDPSDRTTEAWLQVQWLREIGFEDADCYWKWLEMALMVGVKPSH